MKPLKTAILGCGGWGTRHAQNIAKLPEQIELVACCDQVEKRAQALAQKYAVPSAQVFTDHQAMLDRVPLDLVLICLPPYAHTNEVDLAAERGIHLLIEKPIALTSEHAWRMVEVVEKAQIRTQVGFMYRFGAAVKALKALIDSGQAGPVGLMSARYFCNSLHNPWWIDRAKSGGQVFEQAIHLLDLMRYFMGEPEQVYSKQRNLFHQDTPGYTVEDVSGTVISFRNGGLGVLAATNGAIPQKWIAEYQVVARNVTVDFDDSNHAVFTFTSSRDAPWGTNYETLNINSEQDDYLLELQDLLNAIETGGPTTTPMREGALTLELALATNRIALGV